MKTELLSTLSSSYRRWLACVPVLALCLGCHESKPLTGELSVVADLRADGWCNTSAAPTFQGLEFRALGHDTTVSLSPAEIATNRGHRELPPGLYTVSVSPAADVPGGEGGAGLAFVDAPIVSVLPSQVTTVTVQIMSAGCALSSRL